VNLPLFSAKQKRKAMKSKSIIIIVCLISTLVNITHGQNDDGSEGITTAAVLTVYSNLDPVTPDKAGSLLRIELVKTGRYKVLDKHDILEIGKIKEINLVDCYGRNCLNEVGKNISVDKMFSGSIEQLGNKIVISLKILDIATGNYDKTTIMEFVEAPLEIQTMIQLTLNTMLGIENDQEIVKTLIYYQQPPETPQTDITNNGPRVGAALILGEMGSRMQAPVNEGGWGAVPVVSQFGYQVEKEYLSAGDFHALIEGLFILSGPEQQLFNPKLIVMNGFRSGNTGLEFAFGPSFGVEKEANSFYNSATSQWQLESEWLEVDTNGAPLANPYDIVSRMDSRGKVKLSAGWVVAVGKTFHSGYLNIPVNLFASFNKHGWQTGLSLGFNLKKRN